MYFCSFVIKSNEASSKYSPRCTQQFSYDVHWWTVPQDFHKPSPIRNFPTFIYRTFFLCWFLLFSALEISKNPLKDIKKIIRFWKSFSYVSFPLQTKLFLWETAPLFSTLKPSPKGTCSLVKPWWSSWNGIRASAILFTRFFSFDSYLIPPHLNLRTSVPRKSVCNFDEFWKKSLHGPFHKEPLLLVAAPLLSN